jgi:hypothetical protein
MKLIQLAEFIMNWIARDTIQRWIFIEASWIYKITIEKVEMKDNWIKPTMIFIDDLPQRYK